MHSSLDHSPAQPVAPLRTFEPFNPSRAGRERWRHNAASAAAAPLNLFGRRAAEGSFGILMYHRVTPNPRNASPPTYNVTPGRFESQLSSLISTGFSCWPLQRVLDARDRGQTVPPKTFVITFDDGYANNAIHALPILKRLDLPATIFLATSYLDCSGPFPFDYWAAGRSASLDPHSWTPLTRDQCHEMLESGVITFGAHTHTHADFRLAPDAIEADLATCCEILEEEFGIVDPPFTFPFGDSALGFADHRFAAAAKRVGCTCAMKIDNRLVTSDDDVYSWPRFDIASGETGWTIAAKLNGWYERLRSVSRRMRRGLEPA